jgi:hypothetical protein
MNGAAVLILALTGLSQTAKADAGAQRLDMKELKQTAARYQIAMNSDSSKNLILVTEPILHWTNPLRGTVAGAVFVWVADGRPEAVASFFQYTEAGKTVEDDEFQSLATIGLRATRDGQAVWTPQAAGIELAPIPGAPKPASAAAERLRQMRALAHEFHAFFDLPAEKSELRLLPKPLYRYETNRLDLPDGALFAFVQTTDPEVLLVIEARSAGGAGGAPVWHYAFARMSMVNLRAQHKDRTVWSVNWATNYQDATQPYVTLRAPDRPR